MDEGPEKQFQSLWLFCRFSDVGKKCLVFNAAHPYGVEPLLRSSCCSARCLLVRVSQSHSQTPPTTVQVPDEGL